MTRQYIILLANIFLLFLLVVLIVKDDRDKYIQEVTLRRITAEREVYKTLSIELTNRCTTE